MKPRFFYGDLSRNGTNVSPDVRIAFRVLGLGTSRRNQRGRPQSVPILDHAVTSLKQRGSHYD
jgi:hypothetical protein